MQILTFKTRSNRLRVLRVSDQPCMPGVSETKNRVLTRTTAVIGSTYQMCCLTRLFLIQTAQKTEKKKYPSALEDQQKAQEITR